VQQPLPQQLPPLQQGIEQQLDPLAECFERAEWTLCRAFATLPFAAEQQGASQQATLQQAVLHLDASQQPDLAAANAAVVTRASAGPARIVLFMCFLNSEIVNVEWFREKEWEEPEVDRAYGQP
jgi:hypothetical protein